MVLNLVCIPSSPEKYVMAEQEGESAYSTFNQQQSASILWDDDGKKGVLLKI